MDLSSCGTGLPNFRITCIATSQISSQYADNADDNRNGNSLLLAGGFLGDFAFVDLTSERPGKFVKGFLTTAFNSIVNHIQSHPDRRSGLPQAVFCCNDRNVRVMDLKTLQYANVTEYEHAINCSAISPDNRLRALVGDACHAFIASAEGGEILTTLNGHTDHAFACAWSPCSRIVATGAQDGKTILWDARKWSKPLHTFHSRMSCPRSLHFADDGALVMAESEDVVSICDTKDFARRQDLRFFGAVGGVALLDGGAEIIVANLDRNVGGLFNFQRRSGCDASEAKGRRFRRTKRDRDVVNYADPEFDALL